METIETTITNFKNDPSIDKIVIENTNYILNSNDNRKYIHELCGKFNIYSKSSNINNTKIITITKNILDLPVVITDDDRAMFIKDFKLPITIPKEPYFSYFINSFDPLLSTKHKYGLLVDAINKLQSQNITLKHYSYTLIDKITDVIKQTSQYKDFIDCKDYKIDKFPSNKNIYTGNVTDKYYISIDIRTANFTSVKFFNKGLVLGCDDWQTLIKSFTDIEYFIQSKHFRQVVFGKVNGIMSKCVVIQKYLTKYLHDILVNNGVIITGVSNDEIVIETTKETMKDDMEKINKCIQMLPNTMTNIWKIVTFTLSSINNSVSFLKTILDNDTFEKVGIEIRNTDKDFYPQVYKYVMGIPLEPYDMKFGNKGFVCNYDEPYFL